MQKTVYQDNKYSMQDTSRVYLGCKYTFQEVLDSEEILFKLRLILQKYVIPEADPEDTLETHLYYLGETDFLVKLYRQMKTRIKVNVIAEKKSLTGKKRKEYVTKLLKIDELVAMTPAQKEACGMVIQELSVSKLSLLGL